MIEAAEERPSQIPLEFHGENSMLHLSQERAEAAALVEILRGPKPAPESTGPGLARAVEALKKYATWREESAESKEGA